MYKLIFILLLFTKTIYAQNEYKLFKEIKKTSNFITTDKLSNIYLIDKNELLMYNKNGKLLYKYSNTQLGEINFVDVSILHKPLLYYKNFSQIIYLDNTLSINAEPLSLDRLENQETALVCSSFNNGIWIYDEQNRELIHLNKSLKQISSTGNLSILLDIELKPTNIIETNNTLFLNNPSTGILMFDIWGTYNKTIPITNIKHFQIKDNWIYYITDNYTIEAYHIRTFDTKSFPVPTENIINFRLENDLLILQKNNSTLLYTHKR
jgi:hypothetical protein